MFFGFGILATALLLSAVAAYYSVAGLVAIFSAAAIPVIIMGGTLELGKVVATVWLHNNWRRAGWAFKSYLIPAVAFLMMLTSMGIFGYLSKAHSDQGLITGDASAKIAIYDEKIKTERDNIDANRKALKQLDEAVDQVMGRSTSETGAERAVQIRRSQQAERGRLLKEISESQKRIAALNEERAPVAAEVRKVEAEVGPIKYIAALVYGDNPDATILEKAVRLVIIMIVLVFDPLALTLILAANKQFEWARHGEGGWVHDEPRYPPDDGPITEQQIEQIQQSADSADPSPPGWMYTKTDQPKPELSILEQHPYLSKPFVNFENLKPMIYAGNPEDFKEPWPEEKKQELVEVMQSIYPAERPGDYLTPPEQSEADDDITNETAVMKAAMGKWKDLNPGVTLKSQRALYKAGKISELPWEKYLPAAPMSGFGSDLPATANKGDTWVKTDVVPHVMYKFNGDRWILLDKTVLDNYNYDSAYMDHLIDLISNGEYDPDLLSESEQEQLAQRLQQRSQA